MTDFAKQISAYQQLSRVYDSLNDVIGVLEDEKLKNAPEQFEIAHQFIHTVTDANTRIIKTYANIMSREDSTPTTQEINAIEKEVRIIVDAMQDVITKCKNLDRSDQYSLNDNSNELQPIAYDENRMDVFKQLLERKGPLQQLLHQEAARLGPQNGGKLLLEVDKTGLHLLDAIRAMKIAGIPIDFNRLPSPEAKPERFGMNAPPYHMQDMPSDVVTPIHLDSGGITLGGKDTK